MSDGSSSNDPWSWLGLLKWSLAYTDGTHDSNLTPMSAEDRAFLEKVMKEGIVDEGERMKEILKETSEILGQWKQEPYTNEADERVQVLWEELRDIVEQIDYARTFAAMSGLQFLLGCVGERKAMPRSVRILGLGIIATLCQNNPPVQQQLLELGALRILSELFFIEDDDTLDEDGQLRARILQAISANVRSHEVAESVFCQLDQAVALLERGLGVNAPAETTNKTPVVLLKRSIFFLRALVTSDASTRERVQRFSSCIGWIADHLVDLEGETEIREMSLELLQEILRQKKSVNVILARKDALLAKGAKQVAALSHLTGEEREFATMELELWESLMSLLAEAKPDEEATAFSAGDLAEDIPSPPIMLLGDGSADDPKTLLPQ